MTAESVTGIGQGSAEGPLRGYDLDNIRKVYINQSGSLLPCIYVVGNTDGGTPSGGAKYVLRAIGDGQVKVSSLDQVPGYLVDKLIPGLNINFTISAGLDQTITINSTGGGGGGSSLLSSFIYTCPSTAVVNDAVYSTGPSSVGRANATSQASAPAFAFISTKLSSTTCQICYSGELPGFVGLTPGLNYYLNTVDGGIQTTAPSGSGNVIQPMGFAVTPTTLVVNPQNFVVL